MRVYVGNLSFQTNEEAVRGEVHGAGLEPLAVQIMMDRMTGQSRGFAFVELATREEVQTAIEALDGKLLDGRPLRVNEAQERVSGGAGG
ncbi:MAG: RNA-binding protein, partial [Chloroflexi bacterium]|nr:RNA-binding protein [Chloroflexota bacterium]